MGDPHKRKVLKFQQSTANEQQNANVRSLQFVWDPASRQLLIAIKNQHDTTTFPLSWRDSSDFADWLREQVNNQRNTRLSIRFDDGQTIIDQGEMLVYNRGWKIDELKTYFERYFRRHYTVPSDCVVQLEVVEDFVEDTHEIVYMFDEDGKEIVGMA
jgi:hypothetical protein